MYVGKRGVGQVVEIHQSMVQLAAARGFLDSEADLLQRHPAVIGDPVGVMRAVGIGRGALQRAVQAALVHRFVVGALAVVVAVPGGLAAQQLSRALQCPQVVDGDGQVRGLVLRRITECFARLVPKLGSE